jgi:hypothetical protein
LSQEYQDVIWTDMSEQEDNIDFQQDSACAGGACELPAEYLAALRETQTLIIEPELKQTIKE